LLRKSLKQLFSGIYKRCECGKPDCLIPIINKLGKFARFKSGHNSNGKTHPNWKGGRMKKDDYWLLWMPDAHPTDVRGYIREHIYIYQEYHKLCMLPWGDVHHKDGNGSNNEISNLQGMMNREHTRLHMKGNKYNIGKHIDTSDRFCFNCGTYKTSLNKIDKYNKTPSPRWLHLPWDKVNWYCHNCYRRLKKRVDIPI
jgi:HNH endonuclease